MIENNKSSEEKGNVIFVGGKPLVNYVRGVVIQFTKNNSSEVVIKSRGKFISKAVDIAEIAKRSLDDLKVFVKEIKISSEQFESSGKQTNVSLMEIVLSK